MALPNDALKRASFHFAEDETGTTACSDSRSLRFAQRQPRGHRIGAAPSGIKSKEFGSNQLIFEHSLGQLGIRFGSS